MKSALLERECHDSEAVRFSRVSNLLNHIQEERLLKEGIQRYPSFNKLHLMLSQLYVRLGRIEDAKAVLVQGLPLVQTADSVPLWLELSRLEERTTGTSRARAVLEKARLKVPANPLLWLEAIRIELRNGDRVRPHSLH